MNKCESVLVCVFSKLLHGTGTSQRDRKEMWEMGICGERGRSVGGRAEVQRRHFPIFLPHMRGGRGGSSLCHKLGKPMTERRTREKVRLTIKYAMKQTNAGHNWD